MKYLFRLLVFPVILLAVLGSFTLAFLMYLIGNLIMLIAHLRGEWVKRKDLVMIVFPFIYVYRSILDWFTYGELLDPFNMEEYF